MSRRGPARLTSLAVPLTLALALGLTACGDGGEDPSTASEPSASDTPSTGPEPGEEATDEPEDTGLAIDLTRENDEFTPNGERVDVGIDQTLTVTITSDDAGELHVHSVPEQEIVYDAGTSEHTITIDRPGVVEVESHEPDLIVLQLEVR